MCMEEAPCPKNPPRKHPETNEAYSPKCILSHTQIVSHYIKAQI